MKNYQLNNIGYIGIILTTMMLCFTSCKKEENKAPTPTVTTPVPTSTSDTYVIQNYNSNSYNVDDTLQLITTTSGAIKLTIPVNYGLDTISMVYDSVITSTMTSYSFDHIVKNNTAYHLVGNMYKSTGNYIQLSFSQRIPPYGVANSVQNYNLQYTKL